MTIDGEGAGKGDVFRPVDRNKYNENFEGIVFPKANTFTIQKGKLHKVYPKVPDARSK